MSKARPTADRRWDDVEFTFYGPHGGSWDEVLVGEAREHSSGMVLSIEDEDGPWVIAAGRSPLGGFAGQHQGAVDDPVVRAHWNAIGDRQVGVWHQDGELYFFTFILKGFHRAQK